MESHVALSWLPQVFAASSQSLCGNAGHVYPRIKATSACPQIGTDCTLLGARYVERASSLVVAIVFVCVLVPRWKGETKWWGAGRGLLRRLT